MFSIKYRKELLDKVLEAHLPAGLTLRERGQICQSPIYSCLLMPRTRWVENGKMSTYF
jgi:hypothetical protein